MLLSLLSIGLAFYWLLVETDYLRIRLLAGRDIDYGKLWIETFGHFVSGGLVRALTEQGEAPFFKRDVIGYRIIQSLNGKGAKDANADTYDIMVSPGIKEILCGGAWLNSHWNDLKDYQPQFELVVGGNRYNMTIRKPSVLAEVMKVNKLSRQERKQYATA